MFQIMLSLVLIAVAFAHRPVRAGEAEMLCQMIEAHEANLTRLKTDFEAGVISKNEFEIKTLETKRNEADIMRRLDAIAAGAPPRPDPNQNMDLQQRVTFEFQDMAFVDAIDLLRKISRTTIIIDPRMVEKLPAISLKVQDMTLQNSLEWICKLAEARFERRDNAIFITQQKEEAPAPAPREFRAIEDAPKKAQTKTADSTARLHVKLANGVELDAEGQWVERLPETAQMIIDQFIDAPKDGALSYRLPEMDQAAVNELVDLVKRLAPSVAAEFSPRFRVLNVVSENTAHLRRVQGLMRSLRVQPLTNDAMKKMEKMQFMGERPPMEKNPNGEKVIERTKKFRQPEPQPEGGEGKPKDMAKDQF